MPAIIHKDDVGTIIQLVVTESGQPLNISTAAVKKIKLSSPSSRIVQKDATFTTNGVDGKIECATSEGDITEAGLWRVQGYVELNGWRGHTTKGFLTVNGTL